MSDESILGLEAERRRKTRRLILAASLAVVVGGVGVGLAVVQAQRSARAGFRDAVEQGVVCLGGGRASSSLALAFRNEQLVQMGLSQAERTTGEKCWPNRCASSLHSIADLANDGGNASLGAAARDAAKVMDGPTSLVDDASTVLERLDRELGAVDLNRVQVGASATAATHLTLDTLAPSARLVPEMIPLESIRTESTPSGRLVLLIDSKTHPNLPAVCSSDEKDGSLVCHALPASLRDVTPGLSLYGTSDRSPPPFVFAGERGKAGIYDVATGKSVAQGLTYGAAVLASGVLARTTWNESTREVWFTLSALGEKERSSKLLSYKEVGNPYYNSGLFWDWLVYKAWVPNKDIQLLARKVAPDGSLGPVQFVGELFQRSLIEAQEVRPHITACRTADVFVVRVKGVNEQYTAFHVGGEWKPPVASPGTEGELTCRDKDAFITWLSPSLPNPWVSQTKCSSAACAKTDIDFKKMLRDYELLRPEETKHLSAAELRGDLVLVWSGGSRGGLRMRVGPAEGIMKASTQLVYDDLVQDGRLGAVSTLVASRVIAGPNDALLLLSTLKGIFVYRIQPSGELRPAKVIQG